MIDDPFEKYVADSDVMSPHASSISPSACDDTAAPLSSFHTSIVVPAASTSSSTTVTESRINRSSLRPHGVARSSEPDSSMVHIEQFTTIQEIESLITSERYMKATESLRDYRSAILRQSSAWIKLASKWRERTERIKGVNSSVWETLRVKGKAIHSRQAQGAQIAPELIPETKQVARELLPFIGINDPDLDVRVIKVLRSPPLAGQQRMHCDVPPDVKTLSGDSKARRCLSFVLHLNFDTTAGTHVPNISASLIRKVMSSPLSDGFCDDSRFFTSTSMQGGDILIFYGDTPHFGPANHSMWKERDVLFIMMTPDDGENQDAQQQFWC